MRLRGRVGDVLLKRRLDNVVVEVDAEKSEQSQWWVKVEEFSGVRDGGLNSWVPRFQGIYEFKIRTLRYCLGQWGFLLNGYLKKETT